MQRKEIVTQIKAVCKNILANNSMVNLPVNLPAKEYLQTILKCSDTGRYLFTDSDINSMVLHLLSNFSYLRDKESKNELLRLYKLL